jgi:hypothetical protein
MSTRLTADARTALARAGFSRRAFLKGSGALIVTFGASAVFDDVGTALAQGFNGTGSAELDSWIAIGQDGVVTAYTGKCDFGQGLYTAQMQLVAEELCVPLDRVRLIQCDTSLECPRRAPVPQLRPSARCARPARRIGATGQLAHAAGPAPGASARRSPAPCRSPLTAQIGRSA